MSEKQFQESIIQVARMLGWKVAHFRPAQTSKGWRTPVSGDGKGFPDLVLVKGSTIIFAELKVGKNKLTPEQQGWMNALHDAACHPKGRVFTRIWTPDHQEEIEKMLTEKGE